MINLYKSLRNSGISWWGSLLMILFSPVSYILDKISDDKENLSLFGKEEIEISQEDLKKAALENEKDKEALEIPTFTKES